MKVNYFWSFLIISDHSWSDLIQFDQTKYRLRIHLPIDWVHKKFLYSFHTVQQLVTAWTDQLGLKLNAGKTQALLFDFSVYVKSL